MGAAAAIVGAITTRPSASASFRIRCPLLRRLAHHGADVFNRGHVEQLQQRLTSVLGRMRAAESSTRTLQETWDFYNLAKDRSRLDHLTLIPEAFRHSRENRRFVPAMPPPITSTSARSGSDPG